MIHVGKTLTVKMGNEEREAAYASCQWRWIHWGGRCAVDRHTHSAFRDMPFVRSIEEADYETKLIALIGWLLEENLVLTEPWLSLWCGSGSLDDEWFAFKQEY